jgi:hypothetical protein
MKDAFSCCEIESVDEAVTAYCDFLLPLDVVEEYPSVYHPPPFSSNVQVERIFLAILLHLVHRVFFVPMGTSFSVICPLVHSNS